MESPSTQRRKSSRIEKRRSVKKDQEEGDMTEVKPSTSREVSTDPGEMDPGMKPEIKAMSIELIIERIFSKMDASTLLKTARVICKQWKNLADKNMKKRDLLQLRFDRNHRPLNEGLKQLKNTKDLPCFDFHLDLPENVTFAEIKNFISLFGKQIKSLSLNSAIRDNKILLTLLNGSPTLETLKLSYNFIDKMGQEEENFIPPNLSPAQLSLKSLKHLKYIGDPDIPCLVVSTNWYGFSRIYPIILSATNLISIHNIVFGSEVMNLKSNGLAKRAYQIKSASDTYLGRELLNLADYKPQLERFFINPFNYYYHKYSDVEKAAINDALNRIFVSSQNSMKELALTTDFMNFDVNYSGSFPHFDNLEVLKLKIGNGCLYQKINLNDYFGQDYLLKYSQSQDLQEKLPKLKTICFGMTSKHYERPIEGEFIPLPPDFSNKLNSVENLIIEGIWNQDDCAHRHCNWEININSGWLERVKDLFPNVKCLTLRDSSYLNLMLPKFFNLWPDLEVLEIHIRFIKFAEWYSEFGDEEDVGWEDYNDVVAVNKYPNLDSVLTGLPIEFCERLSLKNDENIEKMALNVDSRSTPSLLSLKGLKRVDFIFDDIRAGIAETKCPITPISCLYAFKLIPNLKVTIRYPNLTTWNSQKKFEDTYNLDKYFEQLAPYCNFGLWKKPEGFNSFLTRLG